LLIPDSQNVVKKSRKKLDHSRAGPPRAMMATVAGRGPGLGPGPGPLLPRDVADNHGLTLKGPFRLTVVRAINVSRSLQSQLDAVDALCVKGARNMDLTEDPATQAPTQGATGGWARGPEPKRMLSLTLVDAAGTELSGMEYRHIPQLDENSAVGAQVG
jgi:hypothetical protein